MLRSTAFRAVILVLVALVLVFSCSDSGDKRKEVKKELGEPDDIVKSEYAGMKAELYVYARKDINRTYEFRKTTGGCGGDGDWYVYRLYYTNYIFPDIELYLPPTIRHDPIVTAPPHVRLTVSAEVTDDVEVVTVTLYYRVTGQEEYQSIRMTGGEENVYSAIIPAEFVTSAGVEYYIEARDEGHSSETPEKGNYIIEVSSGEMVKTDSTTTTARTISPSILRMPAAGDDAVSPVAP